MIRVSDPLILNKDLKYVDDAVKSGWVSSEGRFIGEFENKFAAYTGRKFGVAVNNGTNALILAVKTLGIPPGSEVILPSFAIISCALACVYNNLIPVFVDSCADTWNIDPGCIEAKVTKRTRAIMIVHTYGSPVDVNKIMAIAKKFGLYVIEDFAEAIGSIYRNRKCGSFGHVSATSFYANKLITTGEGGMCLTDNERLAERLRRLKNLDFRPKKRFVHQELGFNFRMTNMQAALGLAQLERIDKHIERKLWMKDEYSRSLKRLVEKGLVAIPIEEKETRNVCWMYGIVLTRNSGARAREIIEKLARKGIETRPFFYPLHLQPAFRKFPWFKEQTLPVSEKLHRQGLYLPSGLTLKKADIRKVAKALSEVL